MRLSGLPEDIHVLEYAEFVPEGGIAEKLEICELCGAFNPNYMLCSEGHVTCKPCSLGLNEFKECPDDLELWCSVCDENKMTAEVQFPINFLKKIEFYCACGFKGILESLKDHLRTTGTPKLCRTGKIPFEATKDSPLSAINYKNLSIEEVSIKIEKSLFETEMRFRHPTSNDRDFFWINFQQLSADYRYQKKVIDRIPVTLTNIISSANGVEWFTFYVGVQPETKIDVNYPVEKNIEASVYSTSGMIWTSLSLATFKDGKAICDCFEKPSKNIWGVQKSLKLSDLENQAVHPNGFFCVSVELSPLK